MGSSHWRNFLFVQAIVHIYVISCLSVSVGFKNNRCYGDVRIGNNDLEIFDEDRWDFNNSKVLCTSSSCGTALKSQKTPTSKETPDFLCTGNEKSFDECQRRNNKTQSSAKKALVVCSVAMPPPSISLTLPNGTSINSSRAEIPRGSSVSIKCTTDSTPDTPKRFVLQRNGNSTETPKPEPSQQGFFNISVADYNDEGNYSCTYTVDLNGTYESAESARIHVTVRDPWWKLLLYILPSGVLVLLLMVLSVACLVCRRRRRRRRRKQAEKPSDVVLNQVMVRRNYMDDEEEEEEEEERDYVNVKPAEINSLGTGEMGEKDNDSYDYEDLSRGKSDSSDDEHDYVSPSVSPAAARDGTKEQSEEEDSSDDGEDYVNLVEQTVDIYSMGTEEMGEKDNDSHDYEDLSRGKSDSSDDEEDYVNLVEQTVDIYVEQVAIYDNL